MKHTLLSLSFFLLTTIAFCKTWVINNSGTTFTPATTTITFGDTVKFVLESSHDAQEVSQGTWNGNKNTPLAGGFSLNFGGGTLLPADLAVGTHYFVCTPHASLGMKGTIVVKDANGIAENRFMKPVSIFPNPATDFITIKIQGMPLHDVPYFISDETGKQVLTGTVENDETILGTNKLAAGVYFFQAQGLERRSFSVIK